MTDTLSALIEPNPMIRFEEAANDMVAVHYYRRGKDNMILCSSIVFVNDVIYNRPVVDSDGHDIFVVVLGYKNLFYWYGPDSLAYEFDFNLGAMVSFIYRRSIVINTTLHMHQMNAILENDLGELIL